MIEDVYSSTPAEWLQQMTRWQYFTPESLEEMTQEGLEEIFQQYAQTIEAFRPVKSAVSYHYDDEIFDDEDDGLGDDLWIAEDEQDLPLPPTILPSQLLEQQQQSQLQEQEQESCQSKTNSVDSSTSTIFSQPNATLSNESINNEIPARAPSPLVEKPLPANPVVLADDTAKQARRKSGFGGNKNRLSWTSDTGITSSVVSQNLANEIMSLFDMDFAIDIKVDTAPKLPELPFKPRRRSQQRQSQDMLTSLIPAFEKIALENSIYASSNNAANKVKPNLVIRSVPQRSSSLRHRQELQLDTKSPLSPPATPSDSPTVEKTLSKKKSLLRLASLMTGKKASHKDIPSSPEPSPITTNGAYYHESPTVSLSGTGTGTAAVVNTPRKTSTSTVDSSVSSSSSSWSFVSENGELKITNRPQKPLPEPPTSPNLTPSNGSNSSRSKRSAKKKRKSIMEKTMSKRKSNNALQSVYDTPAIDHSSTAAEKGLGRSKSAFIKIGNGLKSKKQLKQIRRTSSAKNFSETIPAQQQQQQHQASSQPGDIGTHFHYHTSSEVNNMYTGVSDETIVPINTSQQSFVKRMASFNWRIKSKHKQQPVEV
ncbi:hypothetical protein HMPREF1544_02390 [Mucor circinelloides 1006PhL]|uniref:Uncharacterized protein n=1 Tax=Mucor circinelloides f. circinelloides (strain 1006PhL) TaxID=1220926 RepID=S2JQN1_MUCC1|nr:hypothetical protein HMPREF1544_02390 [Mucor circinelloides 1006PhL]